MKIKLTRQLSIAEVAMVANVDDMKLLCDVFTTVPKDLVGEPFPQLWENLVASPDKLETFISYATDRYINLYMSCTGRDILSYFSSGWMSRENSHVNQSKQMKAQQLLRRLSETHVSQEIKRTVLAILLNAVYLGLCKQMAIALEKISTSTQQSKCQAIR